jgi:hypothetical protein
MKSGLAALCAAAVCAAVSVAPTAAQNVEPARATTSSASQSKMKVCAEEWNAKKAANETGSQKYRDFVKECLSRTAAAPEPTAPAATPAAPPTAPGAAAGTPPASQPPAAKPSTGARTATPAPAPSTTAPAAKPAAPGEAVFPTAVSPKYSSESAGRARMHTCLDQYNANKATNGNGGLNWIEKGGGYYSECNKRLKG